MATPLGKVFFNNKRTVSQCDDETLGSNAETLVIQFDQERFEQILSEGGSSPINVRKHRKISLARSPLAIARKQVSDEMKKDTSILIETKLASRHHLYAACEARSASKAIQIEKSTSASHRAKRTLVSASDGTHVVFGCETTSVLHKAQLHFTHEAKCKIFISANSEATLASLPVAKVLSCGAKIEALFGANNEATSLKEKQCLTVLRH